MARSRDLSKVLSSDTSVVLANELKSSFRNVIINGAFNVWQRSTGPTNVVGNSVGYTTADRWAFYQNNASPGVQTSRSTDAPTEFLYSLKWSRVNGNTTTDITVMPTALETIDSIKLKGKTVTLSFYAKKGANFSGSGLGVGIASGTGTDQSIGLMSTNSWTGFSYLINPFSTEATLTTSWQRFTYSATVPSNISQLGLYFKWNPTGTAGADDSIYITGIQLEEGSVATPYEHKPFDAELAQCQRYFIRFNESVGFIGGAAGNSNQSTLGRTFPVVMRAAPTMSHQNTRTTDYYTAGGTNSALTSWHIQPHCAFVVATHGNLYGGGRQVVYLESSGGTSYVEYAIEL